MESTFDNEANEVDEELLARVAWLYYNDGLTQGEVGDAVRLSRIKVSRLLEQGRSSGLIQLRINSRYEGCLALERRLCDRYALADCRVIPAGDPDRDIDDRIGRAAAQYLMRHLSPGALLAVGWGATVARTIHRLGYVARQLQIALISLSGGVSTYLDGLRSSTWASDLHLIPAPLLVGDGRLASALRREPEVGRLLEMAANADYKLVGIGAVSRQSTVFQAGQLASLELESLRRRGAVGDVLCQFYDRAGRRVEHPVHDRVIGVDLADLVGSRNVIGAAGGANKTDAVRAALAGRLLDILITDEGTAASVLGEPDR